VVDLLSLLAWARPLAFSNGLPGVSFAKTRITRIDIPSYYFIHFYFSCAYNWIVWVGSSSFIDSGRLKQNYSGKQLTGDAESI
jgi:hypothetical protein